MTIRLKAAGLMLLWLLFVVLLLYLSSLIADRVNEVSRAGSQNIYVRISTEVQR